MSVRNNLGKKQDKLKSLEEMNKKKNRKDATILMKKVLKVMNFNTIRFLLTGMLV